MGHCLISTRCRWLRAPVKQEILGECVLVGEGVDYTPTEQDLNHAIICEVHPGRSGGEKGVHARTGVDGIYSDPSNAVTAKGSKGKRPCKTL